MAHSRRDFLEAASAAALSLAGRGLPLGGGLAALPGLDVYPHAGEKDLEELAARALAHHTGQPRWQARVRLRAGGPARRRTT
jgi:hypothetical protein